MIEFLARQDRDLPPFPMGEAQRAIRGKARARAALRPSSFPCDPVTLSLPSVFVRVKGLEEIWSFRRSRRLHRIEVRPESAGFTVLGIRAGERLGLYNLRNRKLWGIHLVVDGVPGGPLAVEPEEKVGLSQLVAGTRHLQILVPPCPAARPGSPMSLLMTTSIRVTPHPLFAVTDAHGRFRLPELPDGDYELVAIHELLGEVTKKVAIRGKDPQPVTFVFNVPQKLRALPEPKK